jgi:hypothetical protein
LKEELFPFPPCGKEEDHQGKRQEDKKVVEYLFDDRSLLSGANM